MKIKEELIDILMKFEFEKLTVLDISKKFYRVDTSMIGKNGVIKLVSKEWPCLKEINLGYICVDSGRN